MRVLVITWEYPPYVVGGLGKHVAELIPVLGGLSVDSQPLTVDVVTTHFADSASVECIDDYTTIYRVDTAPPNPKDLYNSVVNSNMPLLELARDLGRRHPYDLIHVHDWLTGEAGIVLKHEWRIPLLVTVHATERGRHQGFLPSYDNYQIDRMEWRVCFEAWHVIVCSKFMFDEVQQYFGLPSDKVTVIPNGINLAELNHCPQELLDEMRQSYASSDQRLLFFVGRIVHEKGLHILLEAMPLVLQKYPNTRLLVAGRNSSSMLPLAHRLGIADSVTFLGYITDETRDCLYQLVDAAIFPSLYEPFGIVALEAMALNCNVIASNAGGLAEVVQHMRNGLTVYSNDPQSIAWAVDQLFSHPHLAQERRRWARYEVNTRYNWKLIGGRTADLYEAVLRERRDIEW